MEISSQIIEVFKEMESYSSKLIPAVEKTARYFKTQREDKGIDLLIPVIEGLQWTVEVVINTKTILKEKGVCISQEEITRVFGELVEAMNNRDYILVADLLEYEVLDMLGKWKQGVSKILEGAA